jgi:hypothetical protein
MASLNLGMYQGPGGAVTLFDGTVISDPANTRATAEDCLPFACGNDQGNNAARYWCAFNGNPGGSPACTDMACDPYRPAWCVPGVGAQQMPKTTTQTMPDITSTAHEPPPPITPESLMQRLPDIVNPAPVIVPTCADAFAQWVDGNKLLAVGGLALLAWALLGKGK